MKSNEDSKRKYVHNTVVHIANKDGHYTLNGYGIKTVLCYVMAFLFNNSLVGKRFQFFTDGHRVLDKTILHHFNWYKNKGIILDWFHLVKKCKEQLSLALNGRLNRNMVLSQIMPLLWVGLTDKAIASLKEVDDSVVKSPKAKEKLIDYLERNRSNIPCYAIRKKLGLQNSSAIGEKMNDLLVSKRQKHNGMSWSKDGSVALASITAIKRNGESKRWFSERELDFKIAA
ncbi:MAG: hypothetical protein GY718_19675 [Lentisphaerae bacterium]|nr:hypothetical protein [Lentisphaerota bacterium]